MKKQTVPALLALFCAILCWSSVPLFLKHFTVSLDAWTVNGLRYGSATLLMLPALRRGRDEDGRNPWREALVPALINTLGQVGWALIPYFVTASVMGFGIRVSFLFTLLGSLWLLPEERYLFRSPAFWSGAGICVAGVVFLFWGSLRQEAASIQGLSIMVAASAVWGFYGISVRRTMRGFAPHRSFAVIGVYTGTVIVALMFLFGKTADLPGLAPATLFLIVLSAMLGIALAHVLLLYVLEHLGAVIESGAEMLTPFLTFAGAALLFGERLSTQQWIGGLGVVGGCALMILAHKPQPETAVSTDALSLD